MRTLRQEVAELRDEVRRLQRENLELRQQVGYWKSRDRDSLHRITESEQKVEQLQIEIEVSAYRRVIRRRRYQRTCTCEGPKILTAPRSQAHSLLEATRDHTVPENHFRADSRGVLVKFREADESLRQAVAGMKSQMNTELARTDLATTCRKALPSLQTY